MTLTFLRKLGFHRNRPGSFFRLPMSPGLAIAEVRRFAYIGRISHAGLSL
jgi:hypothetical protein